MTHEELLNKLWILPANVSELQHGAKAVKALRAVVELHKPISSEYFDKDVCLSCTPDIDAFVYYPCPTIKAIQKELE